ncbi:MAG: hypothetical protein WDO13_08905 [Verrucomicrobiota bacterium]
MQNELTQLFTFLPQALGLTDSGSVLLLSLLTPGAIAFVILFGGRELLRPRWRGYWDAV